MSEFAFDLELVVVMRVEADTEEEARQKLEGLNSEDAANFVQKSRDGDKPKIRITEFTPKAGGDRLLFEKDGVLIE